MTDKLEAGVEKPECFLIMPISDPDGYEVGHFRHVYEDLIRPACENAGYAPVRADDVSRTNFIQLDVLNRLLEAPMALCDLSAHNPNVLFELGIRQAFDKPVVLVQEEGTQQIFDIGLLRHVTYRKSLFFREVPVDQAKITAFLRETRDAASKDDGLNSLVKLLSVPAAASLRDVPDSDPRFQLILAELTRLKSPHHGGVPRERSTDRYVTLEVPPPLSCRTGEPVRRNGEYRAECCGLVQHFRLGEAFPVCQNENANTEWRWIPPFDAIYPHTTTG